MALAEPVEANANRATGASVLVRVWIDLPTLYARSFVPYCRGAQRDAGALRAEALAEDVQAPLGLA